eukprot:3629969-Prymnesium_polylepis.1
MGAHVIENAKLAQPPPPGLDPGRGPRTELHTALYRPPRYRLTTEMYGAQEPAPRITHPPSACASHAQSRPSRSAPAAPQPSIRP